MNSSTCLVLNVFSVRGVIRVIQLLFFDIRPSTGNANLVIFKFKGKTNEDYSYDGWILTTLKI